MVSLGGRKMAALLWRGLKKYRDQDETFAEGLENETMTIGRKVSKAPILDENHNVAILGRRCYSMAAFSLSVRLPSVYLSEALRIMVKRCKIIQHCELNRNFGSTVEGYRFRPLGPS